MIRRIAQTLATPVPAPGRRRALHAEMELNLQPPETIIAREIYDLHTLILVICVSSSSACSA